jgi:hypothetical protein
MPEKEFDELNQARTNRVGAWVVLFVGIVGVGLGVWFIHAQIVNSSHVTSDYKSLDQIEQDKLAAMKTQDTDHDGLSDYDETYVYHTSPYLADSDSDGISDKQELMNGTNPNCPEGQNCGPLGNSSLLPPTPGTGTSVDLSALPGETPVTPADLTASASASEASAAVVQAMLNPTPDQVRQLLINSGVKASDLAGVDDATLLQLYQDSLNEAQAQQGNPTAQP